MGERIVPGDVLGVRSIRPDEGMGAEGGFRSAVVSAIMAGITGILGSG
jgi:hypothetical protein